MEEVQKFTIPVFENVEQVMVGKRQAIEFILVALPGSGKTMLARSQATSLGINFKRLQCTPDLLPNDITGVLIFNQKLYSRSTLMQGRT